MGVTHFYVTLSFKNLLIVIKKKIGLSAVAFMFCIRTITQKELQQMPQPLTQN